METSANDRKIAKRRSNFRGGAVGDLGDMGVDVRHLRQSGYVAVVVMLLLFVCLILPLMALLYFDALTLNKRTERTEARIEKLLKSIEEKEKK